MGAKSNSIGAIWNSAPVRASGGAYSIKARGQSEAEIILYGDVGESWFGGVTAKQFSEDLKAVGAVSTINLRINSAGGDVFDGLTIYRRLVEHKARIVVHIDGLAASIASVIAMAGDEIRISEAGRLMIHDAWGVAVGSANDMRTMADLLETTTGSIRDVYVARTGREATQIESWMSAETWFTASEAIENGFATEIVENLRIAARVDPLKHKFRHTPAALTGTPNIDAAKARLARMKTQMARRRAA